jgi:L-arabinokinase
VSFAVGENARAERIAAALRDGSDGDRAAVLAMIRAALGESHAGYTAIGLGCPETDAMVEAIASRGPAGGFHGARISGGGSGGTVVVVLEERALADLLALTDRMTAARTGGVRIVR